MALKSTKRSPAKESLLFNPGDQPFDPPLVENFEAPWTILGLVIGTFLIQLVFFWTGILGRSTGYGLAVAWVYDAPLSYSFKDPSIFLFFSSIFVHINFSHWYFNMIFLCLFGIGLEKRIGHMLLFWCFVTCGVASGVAVICWKLFFTGPAQANMGSFLGSSGAIAGVMACYLAVIVKVEGKMRWNWSSIREHPIRIVQLGGVICILAWFIKDLGKIGSMDKIVHVGHFGGFVAGLAFSEFCGVPGIEK